MPKILPVLMMVLFSGYTVISGALLCFAPESLKRMYELFGSKRERPMSAGHATIQWLREKQTRASGPNRASGLLLMMLGATILIFGIASLFRGNILR